METLGNDLVAKSGKKWQPDYYCEKCDYKCSKIYNWKKHLLTAKHGQETIGNDLVAKSGKKEQKYMCEFCDKYFCTNAGLWKHTKNCKQNTTNNDNTNDELIQYLISENKEFKNLILEVCKNVQGNNTNNINNNMSEFIDSMKLQLSDLESVGKLGFVDGISNIIIKNLEALDVQKRPVHCSDSKRETMYIKEHDKWEKDDSELKQMKELVRTVRDRNITLIATWRDLYPECVKSNSRKTSQFNQICMEAFGGETGGENGTKQEKEDKIISRIAKSVVIDKS
jgi:hypothetical protein